jgi:hypothetical protein
MFQSTQALHLCLCGGFTVNWSVSHSTGPEWQMAKTRRFNENARTFKKNIQFVLGKCPKRASKLSAGATTLRQTSNAHTRTLEFEKEHKFSTLNWPLRRPL